MKMFLKILGTMAVAFGGLMLVLGLGGAILSAFAPSFFGFVFLSASSLALLWYTGIGYALFSAIFSWKQVSDTVESRYIPE